MTPLLPKGSYFHIRFFCESLFVSSLICLPSAVPEQTFCNFRASKSVDRQTSCSHEMSIDGFRGSKTIKGSVGILSVIPDQILGFFFFFNKSYFNIDFDQISCIYCKPNFHFLFYRQKRKFHFLLPVKNYVQKKTEQSYCTRRFIFTGKVSIVLIWVNRWPFIAWIFCLP